MPIDYTLPAKFAENRISLPSPLAAASTLAALRQQTAQQEALKAQQQKDAAIGALTQNVIGEDGSLNLSSLKQIASIDQDAATKVVNFHKAAFPQMYPRDIGGLSPTKVPQYRDPESGKLGTLLVTPGGEDRFIPQEESAGPSKQRQIKQDGTTLYQEWDSESGEWKTVGRDAPKTKQQKPAKPPTESQQKFSLYYKSLEDALPALDSLYESGYKPGADTMKLLSMDPTQWGTEIYSGALNISPQDLEFVSLVETLSEAITRPRSGAALTQKDIQSTLLGYIPRAGESPATVARKRAALGKQMDYLRRISEGGLAQREPGEITIGADRVNPTGKKPSGSRPLPRLVLPTR